ncbi:hypothetical protein ACHAWF_014915 [Thalassiosira exigua]
MDEIFIGIDVGTQGTKAVAYCPTSSSRGPSTSGDEGSGRILARASASYPLLPSDVPGRAEQDPAAWIDAVRSVLRALVSELGLIAPSARSRDGEGSSRRRVLCGVGVSGQQHGMVLLDDALQPLRPAKLWCDVEAASEAAEIRAAGKGRWDHVVPSFTSAKVLWTIRNEPEIWERVRWCVLPHDYVNLVLRGAQDEDGRLAGMAPATDRGDASGSGVFDPVADRYCVDMANEIDPSGRYARSLPEILGPLDICGSLSPQWMKNLGLVIDDDGSDFSETPRVSISVGSGDNMCSALGVGCVRPGTAVLSLGTSGTIFGVSHSPPSSLVAPFADACGKYLPLVCIMSCTGVLNSVLESFFNGNGSNWGHGYQEWTHADATVEAARHPPGCYGVSFLPFLTPGERTPDWPHASGTILGLTASNMSLAVKNSTKETTSEMGENSRPINPIAGLIYRAAMEGISYLLAEGVSTMKRACGDGFQPTCLMVVGGGSSNQLWRQMLADILEMELKFPKEKESASLGAAFQAGAAFNAARNDGATKVSVEDYISLQQIEMEDEVVRPSSDGKTLQLYRNGREQYCRTAAKLFDDHKLPTVT